MIRKPHTQRHCLYLVTVLLAGLAGTSIAQQMNYQGRLTDTNGVALIDGQRDLTFNIYDAGGAVIWGPFECDGGSGDGHAAFADLINGRFNVILGPKDTGGDPLTDAFDTSAGAARFLGIQLLGSSEIAPRQQILSAPTALHALIAQSVVDGAIGNAQLGTNAVSGEKIQDNTIPVSKLTGAGANFWDGNGTSVWRPTGKVGIGTANPGATLQIGGNFSVFGTPPLAAFTTVPKTTVVETYVLALGSSDAANPFGLTARLVGAATNADRMLMFQTGEIDLNGGGNIGFQGQGGNVGIGTYNPKGRLHVAGGETAQMTLGSPSGVTLAVGNATAQYGLNFGVNGNGNSWIQGGRTDGSTTAYDISLQASGGNVGIGISPTKGRLEVSGGQDSLAGVYGYLQKGFAYNGGASLAADFHQISIYAENSVEASHILLRSDERIKHIDGRSDQADDLATLLAIEVTDYTYIDTIGKGNRKQKKVIAQQVEKVYPLAVSKSINEIPDIYQKATIVDGWIVLTTDLKVGERVLLIGAKEKSIYPVVEVEEKRFRAANFVPEGDEVFVFGREVDDFRTVDYDAISMLNISATQELHRRQETQEAKLERQEADLAAKTAEISALKERLEGFDQKFAKLERLLDGRSAVVPVSID